MLLHGACSDGGGSASPGAQPDGTGGTGGAGQGGQGGGDGGSGAAGACSSENCPQPFICRYDTCIPDLGTCATYDDCPGDSYCDANGDCIPYGVPPDVINDPDCQRQEVPEGVSPTVQCEWMAPSDPSDPTAQSIYVYTAPIVADLNLDDDPGKLQPSIVMTTFQNIASARIGTVRVFDGRTCEEQMRIGGADDATDENRPAYGTQWAIGDLDGDVPTGGHPEIVGMHRTSGSGNGVPLNLYALEIDTASGTPTLSRRWYGRVCSAGGDTLVNFSSNQANYGPGIWDINDDGSPEIIVDEMVFDADGCLLNTFSDFAYLSHGVMSSIADVDLDGMPELVRFDRVAGWDQGASAWVTKGFFVPDATAQKAGHVAIADLGQYSQIAGHPFPNELPEVVVVSAETTTFNPNSSGTIRVQTIDGTVVWGPVALHHDAGQPGGHGGPPTASDFDGDGQVEFAAAANQYYAVYDPDCVAALGGQSPAERPGGKCERPPGMESLPDGVLWAQLSQDFSSSGTGSSVFDFNGDGNAEAVYGDECYIRVYEGKTGNVIFSAPASNSTGFELPVIADVDGDFATEIVVARSPGPGCPATDPLFPNSGPATQSGGFMILRDPEDAWASSRPIWNQHAYSVTHVTDDARIPSSSQVAPNWTQPGMNNFRQNTQGDLGVLNVADLTAVITDTGSLCSGSAGDLTLRTRVCNRGTNPVQDGVTVELQSNDGSGTTTVLCSAETQALLMPGDCEEVSCTGTVSGTGNIFVVVDPSGTIADCHPGNNQGAGTLQICPE
ncbi:FG-GAP repeat domain-containing protein [Chondromyces apiculatus]|uniref:FG-GAP repeat domain-containing protein n=1 Tax=Chondromyces apiculatus TaxID=51 RepID=UPI0018CBF356|nr:VCBS repeat-containing protein [Chondromyces apiculatus]